MKAPANEPPFIRAQRAFAQYLRDPEHAPAPPGLPAARVAIYRDAVFYNIERFLSDNFPRVKDVLPATQWDTMVRDYLLNHQATTPTFAKLPAEFLAYLTHTRRPQDDPPYLYELAHFDWLENLIATDERHLPSSGIDPLGDLLTGEIVVNPVHSVERYRFPVHAITADYKPTTPPPQETHLVAFRDRAHHYGVLDLNANSRQLLLAVRDAGGKTDEPTAVINGGLTILTRMRQRELLLGTRVSAN
jgi:uncharacterized protein